jgi:hypothetical protein
MSRNENNQLLISFAVFGVLTVVLVAFQFMKSEPPIQVEQPNDRKNRSNAYNSISPRSIDFDKIEQNQSVPHNQFRKLYPVDTDLRWNILRLSSVDPINVTVVREMFSKEDLPGLYRLLDQDDFSRYWHIIVDTIGFLGGDEDTTTVLAKHFLEGHDQIPNFDAGDLRGKIMGIWVLGRIDQPEAESFLVGLFISQETREQIVAQLPDSNMRGNNPARAKTALADIMQYEAARGLILTRKPKFIQLVESVFVSTFAGLVSHADIPEDHWYRGRLTDPTEVSRDIDGTVALMQVLARDKFIKEVGMETFMNDHFRSYSDYYLGDLNPENDPYREPYLVPYYEDFRNMLKHTYAEIEAHRQDPNPPRI